ncbi:MAG TPA: phosphoribosylanthranilate isomerase [Pseudomonadales bacterium]|nr:phosphoribosylanthranilate isomerase [Pseudomonadales bacterium]
MRIRVKICGITREQDALLAAEAGADAIGFVHWARSPRAVDVQRARSIQAQLPPFVSAVALFVDPSADTVWQVIEATRPDLLQFHGNEEPSFCSAFGVPYIKALKITDRAPDATALGYHAQARGFLLDSHDPVAIGGTGRAFDWSLAPHATMRPIVLAGGLNAANVGRAIAIVRPWAVDVSSGVESAPGIKDEARLRAFMQAVAAASTD